MDAAEEKPAEPKRELSGKLAGLTLPQQVFTLALWPLLEQVLSFLVGFVDTMLAGRLSVEAAGAIGVAAYVVWAVNLIQMALGVGSTAIVSRAIGARNRRVANAVLGQSLTLAVCAGLATMGALYAAAPTLGAFISLKGESLEYATLFLRTVCFATPLSGVLFVGMACLRGAGDVVTPFRVMVVVNTVNALASALLVFGPAPFGGHGVQGIAIATVLAWALGATLMAVALLRNWGGLRLHWRRLGFDGPTIARIARLAAPNFLESSGVWIGQFLVLWVVGQVSLKLGTPAAVAAHAVAVRVEAISYLPGTAMGIAAATLAGQYLGLGDPARARQAIRLCWFAGMAIMGCVGLVFVLVPEQLVRIMTDKPELLELAPPLLRICGPIEVFFATHIILSMAMRGAGDTRVPMLLAYFCIYCLRLPAAYFLGLTCGLGLSGVWYALCGELVVRGMLFYARFRQGGWQRVKV
ncbi:MAG: MATE family efflux transporter [Planctomycetota bacterium]|nr:MATE family efflux transporter [Planctomycetota bacterium]